MKPIVNEDAHVYNKGTQNTQGFCCLEQNVINTRTVWASVNEHVYVYDYETQNVNVFCCFSMKCY